MNKLREEIAFIASSLEIIILFKFIQSTQQRTRLKPPVEVWKTRR